MRVATVVSCARCGARATAEAVSAAIVNRVARTCSVVAGSATIDMSAHDARNRNHKARIRFPPEARCFFFSLSLCGVVGNGAIEGIPEAGM